MNLRSGGIMEEEIKKLEENMQQSKRLFEEVGVYSFF